MDPAALPVSLRTQGALRAEGLSGRHHFQALGRGVPWDADGSRRQEEGDRPLPGPLPVPAWALGFSVSRRPREDHR